MARSFRLCVEPCRSSHQSRCYTAAINESELSVKRIFIGNLDFQIEEGELRRLFAQYGAVDRISVVSDRDSGRSRGFAFVEMTNAEEGEKAIAALNGTQLGSRAISVSEARAKPERESGGGRDRAKGAPRRGGWQR